MLRVVSALLAVLAAASLVLAALLPEYTAQGVEIVTLDPENPAMVATLVGLLVQVGLLLFVAVMLGLRGPVGIAGGLLTGAGILGFSVRAVRLFQLGDAPGFEAATGSWVDLIAEGVVLAAGLLAIVEAVAGQREPVPADGVAEPPIPPPPGEPAAGP